MAKQYSIADKTTAAWKGRVPIMLGVTGHRDIDTSSGKLDAAIRTQCREIKKSYPNSPFVILSGMAEGADRLVARIAMEELDAALAAVLPMPREEFEKDFTTSASKKEFAEILARAFSVWVVGTPEDSNDWKTQGDARNKQYARTGAIVADHAQILFAVWDRNRPSGKGGTGEVVVWFERGYSPPCYSPYESALSPLDPPEPGRLIIVDPNTAKVTFVEERDAKPVSKPNRNSRCGIILRFTEAYNGRVEAHPDAISISRLHPLVPAGAVDGPAAKFIENAYNAADGLSIKYAWGVRLADIIVYSLAVVAFVAFNFLNQWPVASWVYLATTLIMVGLWGGIFFRKSDNHFLEYRSLAEAMRTMFFWRVAGVNKPLWLSYLSRHSGVVHWIRHAVRTLEFCKNCLAPQPTFTNAAERAACISLAKRYWVNYQVDWFTKKKEEHHKHYKHWKLRARVAIAGSFVMAAALAWLAVLFHQPGDVMAWKANSGIGKYGDQLQLILGTLATIGLTARGFVARRADLELTKQYTSQREIFAIAAEMLKENGSDPDWSAERILEQLGEEALQEQAEWLWLRHSRPFEVPA